MNRLSKLGFSVVNGNVLRHAERQPVERDEFFSASACLLPDLADAVCADIMPSLENAYGRWHPSGFMVFPLGTHPELGTLRLHIWPDGARQRQIRMPFGLGVRIQAVPSFIAATYAAARSYICQRCELHRIALHCGQRNPASDRAQ